MQVSVGKVQSPDEPGIPVNDHDFPVIPVIYFVREEGKTHGKERVDLYPGRLHFSNIGFG